MTTTTVRPTARQRAASSLAVIVLAAAALLLAAFDVSYDVWGGMLMAAVLIALTVPLLARQSAREHDRALFWLLVAALALKLLGSWLRYYVAFDVYGEVADAASYDSAGEMLADRFREGNFDTGLEDVTGTDFIRILTGGLYALIGPTLLGGFVFFSWLAFLGMFFLYRAFVETVPNGYRRTYAVLLFFLPSMLFWPSSIGKESWMIFTLGVFALGVAKLSSGWNPRGAIVAGAGLALMGMARPHIAGIAAISALLGMIVKRTEGRRYLVFTMKGIALAAIVAVAILALSLADLTVEGVSFDDGIATTLEQTADQTTGGGSEFEPPIVTTPWNIPLAIYTVLFRPHPLEADSLQSLAVAAETTFLLVLSALCIKRILTAIRSIRVNPYVAFALIFVALMIAGFSSFGNFGLLARQRVQLLPFFFVLVAHKPHTVDEHAHARA